MPGRVALLIDVENLSAAHGEAVLRHAGTRGEVVTVRLYGDFAQPGLAPWRAFGQRHGCSGVQVFPRARRKNASDIRLAVDAMAIGLRGEADGIVVATSDSDFTALAASLREHGVRAYGIGEAKAGQSLRAAFADFTILARDTREKKNEASRTNVILLHRRRRRSGPGDATEEIRAIVARHGSLAAIGPEVRKIVPREHWPDLCERLGAPPGTRKLAALLRRVPGVRVSDDGRTARVATAR